MSPLANNRSHALSPAFLHPSMSRERAVLNDDMPGQRCWATDPCLARAPVLRRA